MSRALLPTLLVALLLGAGWAAAPQLAMPAPAADSELELARAEQRSAREALDSWIAESAILDYHRISTIDLRAATRDHHPGGGPYVLLDVRDPVEWLNRHLEGAVNVPLASLTALRHELPADRDTPIVTYCGDGHRGALAVAALRTLGFTRVRTLTGGLNAWTADGYPVVSYALLKRVSPLRHRHQATQPQH